MVLIKVESYLLREVISRCFYGRTYVYTDNMHFNSI
jgi:hypothetical protein